MTDQKSTIKISVRNLIEFILRSGDIDTQFVGTKRALEGSRIHKKIQKAQTDNYKAEVSLKHTIETANFVLCIEGRVDGIIEQDQSYCIDEIKTTTKSLSEIHENSNPIFWAQAQCYAFIFSVQNDLQSIDIRLTYCEVQSEEITHFIKHFKFCDLQLFFENIINKYLFWAQLNYDWSLQRNQSIKNLSFPYVNYRKGQRELAVATYRTIAQKKKLYANAPTGIGKTISTLFPAIKAIAEGHTSRIFYLTAKTITRSVAEDSISLMRQQNLKLKTITLTAKDKICFKNETVCQPDFCEFARGHFDRVNDAISDILQQHDEFKRELIEKYSVKHQVCPFEFTLDLTLFCDIIICDYNYVFDPRVYLKRFFSENGGDYTFLIDEAHNLIDRAHDMYSSAINKSQIALVKKMSADICPQISKSCTRLITQINKLKKVLNEENYSVNKELPENLIVNIKKLIDECELYLAKYRSKSDELILQLYFDASFFIKISEFFDDHYITLVVKNEKDVSVKLFCLDPSFLLSESLKRGQSSVFFSATLTPLHYYRDVLGGDSDDNILTVASPFSVNNRCLLITNNISTRFAHRDNSYQTITQCLKETIAHRQGNYLSFFPSYSYMNKVYDIFNAQNPTIKTIVQTSSMSESDRERFLDNFQSAPHQSLLGFCVLGGLFSEGIDLKSDRLIGAIIVGAGLPMISTETNCIRNYYQSKNGQGFNYAFVYPGMNKVMQAAGRVIRSDDDKGVIVLIDDRFITTTYQSLFPKEWYPHQQINSREISNHIRRFWSRMGSTH